MKLAGASEREQTTRRNSCPNGRSRLPRSGDRVKALPVPGAKSGHKLPSQDSLQRGRGPSHADSTAPPPPVPGAGGQGSHWLLGAPHQNRRRGFHCHREPCEYRCPQRLEMPETNGMEAVQRRET